MRKTNADVSLGETILNAKAYAIKCHKETNHKYNNKPYSYHLKMVFDYGRKYRMIIPATNILNVLAACWTHDLIEDCRQTYNDVKNATNEEIAELTYALTNEKGKNRKERASDKYYRGIKDTPYATFVKLCDRLANVKYSKDNGSSMLDAYKKEHDSFCWHLKGNIRFNDTKNKWEVNYQPMWDELEELLK